MNKKARSSISYVIFVSLFIAMLSIVNSVFLKTAIKTELEQESTVISKTLLGITDLVQHVPIVNGFWNLCLYTISTVYVHPYLASIILALLSAPLGYLVIRLFRGGG